MIDLDDPVLGLTADEVRAERDLTGGGMMTAKRRLMVRNLKIAIEYAEDVVTLRKAILVLVGLLENPPDSFGPRR